MILEWFSSPKWKIIPWFVSGVSLFLYASCEIVFYRNTVGWVSIPLQAPSVATDTFTSRHELTYVAEAKDGYRGISPSVVTYRITQNGQPVSFSMGEPKRPYAVRFEGRRGETYRVEAEISPWYAARSMDTPHLSIRVEPEDSFRLQLLFNFLRAAGMALCFLGIVQYSRFWQKTPVRRPASTPD